MKNRVEDSELSPYRQNVWKKLDNTLDKEEFYPKRARVENLILTLNDKNNYVVHYRTLKLYLQLGIEINGIYKVLQFRQRQRYNDFNRKNAKTEFEKDF